LTATVASPRDLFSPAHGIAYIDAATYGLPPQPTVDALARALQRWQSGEAEWVAEWDLEGETCRALFADLIGSTADEIALIPTVSAGVGMIASGLKSGDSVLVPEGEFTSVLFPLLVAAERGGITVREVAFDALAESIDTRTTLVAFSLTQSQSGRSARLADICAAAKANGVQVLVDATHAVPFVPVAPEIANIDYLVCHGYKHLLCPRGVAFFYVRRDRWDEVPPVLANWRAGSPRYGRSYGGPLALAENAARFDVSLAWHSWAGARPSLELLVQWRDEGQFERVLALSRRLAAGLELPPPTSSIVCMPVADAEAAETALNNAGVRCAARGGNVRFSPHVYNTVTEIDVAIAAMQSL
jgi:selenocysteine lyase/cysteine desulfurase